MNQQILNTAWNAIMQYREDDPEGIALRHIYCEFETMQKMCELRKEQVDFNIQRIAQLEEQNEDLKHQIEERKREDADRMKRDKDGWRSIHNELDNERRRHSRTLEISEVRKANMDALAAELKQLKENPRTVTVIETREPTPLFARLFRI